MNIFLPYEDNIIKSVQCLDDRRLNKQILECHTMIECIRRDCSNGYINHPVTQFYKNNLAFIGYYGYICCQERYYRLQINHSYSNYFNEFKDASAIKYIPFYAEGAATCANKIRTTVNVSKLFQAKLVNKWTDAIASKNIRKLPKWTKRNMPEFFKASLV